VSHEDNIGEVLFFDIRNNVIDIGAHVHASPFGSPFAVAWKIDGNCLRPALLLDKRNNAVPQPCPAQRAVDKKIDLNFLSPRKIQRNERNHYYNFRKTLSSVSFTL
jgi:hypothetical protein